MLVLRVVLIVSFCVATLGSAGFAEPAEPLALPLLLGGGVVMIATGLVLRRRAHADAAAEHGDALSFEGLATEVSAIADGLRAFAAEADALPAEEFCRRADELLRGPYFEVGTRNEAYLRALGNHDYVKLWDGLAISERLLARAWSMATDGSLELAREEVPRALANLERAEAAAGA